MHILEQPYIGNVRPGERSFKRNSQYSRVLDEAIKASDALTETLNEEQKSSSMPTWKPSGNSVF